ncbi:MULTISPECIES: enoyl-CoA hydratase/isomerase family protein [unclassified Nocardioides]|uniref:enoyl-CoA hydratase/isomerase family protein n=1 Tax=unclassified Nocardioides TaxID=2615069 RepID=UPI0006F8FAE1|nr:MULTISPECIES: enoyl-CoA hydratase/isomerase family protein [unclassified Nocardioides]KQY57216.1 enoyl-CoA hydratase [Nocardioides sp. Root140]KQZ68731.1 enoyl-CoA hydratase [Nocardioides sp. Root151]KRF11860.1 enoyl-CoA hydratase [Nocardioides sp. Soil796]
MSTEILVRDDGPVRVLTMSGPSRINSIGASTAEQLCDEVVAAERDDRVHAMVLTGEGEHFSSGGDAEGVLEAGLSRDDDAMIRFMRSYQRAALTIWNSPLPVVASVAGIAYGGAFNLALSCDLIVCSENARFCQVFLRRGVVPDFGGAYLLPRLVGMQKAKELMLLADEIDAGTAERLGLVNFVVPSAEESLSTATGLAHRLAAQSRMAMSMTKRLLNASTGGTLQSSLELEALSQASVLGSQSAQKSFEGFRER